MKQIHKLLLPILSLIFLLSLNYCNKENPQQAKSEKNTNQILKTNRYKTLEKQISYLLNEHSNYVKAQFKTISTLDEFDRAFFEQTQFIQNNSARNFFRSVQSSLRNNNLSGGVMSISYTSLTVVNGKYAGIQYSFHSDGKNVTISKSANNNGKVIKALYQYDTKGRLLDVKEYKGDKLFSKKTHKIII